MLLMNQITTSFGSRLKISGGFELRLKLLEKEESVLEKAPNSNINKMFLAIQP